MREGTTPREPLRRPKNQQFVADDERRQNRQRNAAYGERHTVVTLPLMARRRGQASHARPNWLLGNSFTPTYVICRGRLHNDFLFRLNRRTTISPNVSWAIARLNAFSFGYRDAVPLTGVLYPKSVKSGARPSRP